MEPDVPVFESEEPAPEKKRRGVTVITPYGRALTFGISKDRIKRLLQTIAQRKERELTTAMQQHKADRLRGNTKG